MRNDSPFTLSLFSVSTWISWQCYRLVHVSKKCMYGEEDEMLQWNCILHIVWEPGMYVMKLLKFSWEQADEQKFLPRGK